MLSFIYMTLLTNSCAFYSYNVNYKNVIICLKKPNKGNIIINKIIISQLLEYTPIDLNH